MGLPLHALCTGKIPLGLSLKSPRSSSSARDGCLGWLPVSGQPAGGARMCNNLSPSLQNSSQPAEAKNQHTRSLCHHPCGVPLPGSLGSSSTTLKPSRLCSALPVPGFSRLREHWCQPQDTESTLSVCKSKERTAHWEKILLSLQVAFIYKYTEV